MIRLLLIAALLAFQSVTVPTPATAQTQTGNDLFRICNAERSSPTFLQEDAQCAGYLSGALDSLLTFGIAEKNGICVPTGIELGQVRDLVRNFLNTYPQLRHQSGTTIVMGALYTGFACKNQRTLRERG